MTTSLILRGAQVFDVVAIVEPFGQVPRDIAGPVVGQKPWSIGWFGVIKAGEASCRQPEQHPVARFERTHELLVRLKRLKRLQCHSGQGCG
jgi:hypothetical protein